MQKTPLCDKGEIIMNSKCLNCGHEVPKKGMKTCCRKCADEYKKKQSREKRKCLYCEIEFEVRKKEKKKLCSEECRSKWASLPENVNSRIEASKEAVKEKYGVDNVFQLNSVKEKSRSTRKELYGNENYNNPKRYVNTIYEKYGRNYYSNMHWKMREDFKEEYGADVDHPLQLEKYLKKRKDTVQEKYGVDNVSQLDEFKDKRMATIMDRYGVENASQSDEVKEKKKQTSLKNFGVDHHLKDYDRLQKHLKLSFKVKRYKDTILHYQGSYEFLFLEMMDKAGLLSEVSNGNSYDYDFLNKEHVYHTDFFFRGEEIEIKSGWTYDKNGTDTLLKELNETKWSAVRNKNVKINVIVDKCGVREFVRKTQKVK